MKEVYFIDKINEYLNKTRITETTPHGYTFEHIRPQVECADGFTVSVQASEFHYCYPRIDGANEYEAVELGYPNMEDPLIEDYAEDPCNLTDTVYGFVPVHIVCELVEKHGGIVN